MLCMLDIEMLGMLTMNNKKVDSQLAPGNNADNRETASVKKEFKFKQKAGSFRTMHTIGRMFMCENSSLQMSHLLLLVQWSWVTSTTGIKVYLQI